MPSYTLSFVRSSACMLYIFLWLHFFRTEKLTERLLAHIIKNCVFFLNLLQPDKRTLRRKLKVKSDPSGGENSSNNSSTLPDQSVHSSKEEDSAPVKCSKKLIHEEQSQSECEDSYDEPTAKGNYRNSNFPILALKSRNSSRCVLLKHMQQSINEIGYNVPTW